MNQPSGQILVIEDNDAKRDSIKVVLHRELPGVDIRDALSVQSAIVALSKAIPDMIIADMSLPTYDIGGVERGGTPRSFGGIEVFEYLARYAISVPVLVVTSYPAITDGSQSMDLNQLTKRLRDEFPSCFVGTVYFDSTYSTWEREIVACLRLIRNDQHGA